MIVLSADERAELVRRSVGPESRRADRARMILACADEPGASNAAVARELGVSPKSVAKWRRRFAGTGLAGLDDDLPIGRPKAELVLDGAERARLVLWARQAKTAQFLERFGPRNILDCKATNLDDPTTDPRWGKVGKQSAASMWLSRMSGSTWTRGRWNTRWRSCPARSLG